MARHRTNRHEEGIVEQREGLDGHRYSLEAQGGRARAFMGIAMVLIPLFAYIEFTSTQNPPWWIFALVGLWTGRPMSYDITLAPSGVRIEPRMNFLGRITERLRADPLAAFRERYASGDGVLVPWERLQLAEVVDRAKGRRTLRLVAVDGSITLDVVVRYADTDQFDQLVGELRERCREVAMDVLPAEVDALRGITARASERQLG
ncbi:MAG: hypothetical protein EP330_19815 [Deltaproteobacteria bacterium]|nr:MAG: hypothetical protein EP330_19815 [Deltaproteobacteria bacterium]